MKKPDFFIVGAPKCGTTAMDEYLRQHPDIFMSAKELHFFGKDLCFTLPRISKKSYLDNFSNVKNERCIGEASVWYLYSESAAREIKEFNPDARIIIMLRNPVDMMYSNHSQCLYNGTEDEEDFRKALGKEGERKIASKPLDLEFNAHCNSYLYREIAKYTDQVKRYIDVFGRENVHVIIFDDFKNDTVETYRGVLKFLAVDDSFKPVIKVINANKVVRNVWLRNFLRSPLNIVRTVARLLIPKTIRVSLIKLLNDWNKNEVSRKAMDQILRYNLIDEFCPEVERLSELLEKDLSRWCKK